MDNLDNANKQKEDELKKLLDEQEKKTADANGKVVATKAQIDALGQPSPAQDQINQDIDDLKDKLSDSQAQIDGLNEELGNIQNDLEEANRKLIMSRKLLAAKQKEFEEESSLQQDGAKASFDQDNMEAVKISGEKEALIDELEKLEYNYDPISAANADDVEPLEETLGESRYNNFLLHEKLKEQNLLLGDQEDMLE